MSNNGFTQRGVRYVLDVDALSSKMIEVALSDDEDIDLSTFGDDTLIAATGMLLKMGFDISSDNAQGQNVVCDAEDEWYNDVIVMLGGEDGEPDAEKEL